MYRCIYICVFSRSEGAGSATVRNTRGLTRSVSARIVPPFPAPSRPSNTTITLSPFSLTHDWSAQSSPCKRRNSASYSFRLNLAGSDDFVFFDVLDLDMFGPDVGNCERVAR